jgi:hypothetical protein
MRIVVLNMIKTQDMRNVMLVVLVWAPVGQGV